MARIVPFDLSRLALRGAHEPELETLATRHNTPPDDDTMFHGVHWTRQYKGRTLYGEIDFVVINNAGRVLCIERKIRRLEESESGLFKDCADERKSVRDQIPRSVDSIREKFAYQEGKNPGLDIEYLVYCAEGVTGVVERRSAHFLRAVAAPSARLLLVALIRNQ